MEKLKKINVVLFTLMAVSVISLMLTIGFEDYWDFSESYDYKVSELLTDNIQEKDSVEYRNQIISFVKPHLIDSSKGLYLVPIRWVDVEIDVEAQISTLELYDARSLYGNMSSGYTNVNNYVLKDFNSLEEYIIFDKKVLIEDYFHLEKKRVILFNAYPRDTNRDGKLNSSDEKKVFLYDLSAKKLNQIDTSDLKVVDSFQISKLESVLITLYSDLNKNNKLDIRSEPTFFKILDLEKLELIDLLNEVTIESLQEILDK